MIPAADTAPAIRADLPNGKRRIINIIDAIINSISQYGIMIFRCKHIRN